MLSSRLLTRLVLLVMFVYLSINSIAVSHISLASNSVPCLRTGLLLKGGVRGVYLEELSLKQLSLISYENYGVLYILFEIT